MRDHTRQQLLSDKLIPILRGDFLQHLDSIATTLIGSGVHILEITMNSPNALQMIEHLARHYGDQALIGAGTVTDVDHVSQVKACGGKFIVALNTYPAVIQAAIDHELEPIPGAFTATEMCDAVRAGAQLIKLFPASQVNPDYIRLIHGPLPHVHVFTTGGIHLGNAKAYLDAGAAGIGVGSDLVSKQFDGSQQAIQTVSQNAMKLVTLCQQY